MRLTHDCVFFVPLSIGESERSSVRASRSFVASKPCFLDFLLGSRYTYVDDEHNRVMSVDFGQSFWDFGEFGNLPGVSNPWAGRPNAAPFDQGFYLIVNVAVGGFETYRILH